MSPLIRWDARLIGFAALLAAPLVFVVEGEALALETCSCDAYFELRTPSNGRPHFDPSFKPVIPPDRFTARSSPGAGTMNACRRKARDQAHSCMSNIWKTRWPAMEDTNYEEPSECHTSRGIAGSVPYNIKWWIERAACQTGSPIANRHNAVVKLYRRTKGKAGCGPNLKTVKEVFVSDYEVDCLSIRHREKLGMVAKIQVTGIDRPGSDLSGSGVTVGNGSVEACKAACGLRSGCKAWTWVPPGIQGSESKCWVKGSVPWYKKFPASAGMVSGTRQHNSQ